MNYKTSGEICKLLKITPMTLNRWKSNGTINAKKLSARKFLYDLDSLDGFKNNISDKKRLNIIYSRVSSSNQKENLKNQTETIQKYMLNNGIIPDEIFEEIASGMNENRLKIAKITDLVIQNKVDKIFITFKDRLARFGFDYFVNFYKEFGTEIVVLNHNEEQTAQDELVNDLISIIHHFSMRIYSNRRKLLKTFKKDLKDCKNSE